MRRSNLFTLLSVLILLLAPFTRANALTAATFGPKQYVRVAGPPQRFADTFPRCAGGACQLVVMNGNADGSSRISSATVLLNGAPVFGPKDFKQGVARLVANVSLADTDRLEVELHSAPGSFLTISVECESFVALRIGAPPGVLSSIWDNGTASLSIPLENRGNAAATDVTITGVTAGGGTYVGPAAFSYPAGTIDTDESRPLYALFANLNGNANFPLTVRGTYGFGSSVCPFQAEAQFAPPPASNGGMPKSTTTAQRFNANTAFYPPAPPPPGKLANAENEYSPPIGQPRNLFVTPPSASGLNRTRAFSPSEQPPAGGSPSDVVFFRNANGGSFNGLPPDPSVVGATSTGFAMSSANTAVSYSTDFGKTFKTVNLTGAGGFSDPANPSRTDFFPENDGGLCCDQVLHYIPGRNLVVWMLQYWSPNVNVGGLAQKGQNRLRIAFATPQAAAADFLHAWSWFDVSPTTLGDTNITDWMDYPDLAFSNDWLYISVDHGFWNTGKDSNGNVIGQQVFNARRWFVRASLADMASSAGSVNLVFYEPTKNGLVKAHFAQSAPDAMYYAAQPDTSTLSVFADPDSSPNIPTPKDIKVSSFCKATATSPCDFKVTAPDNLDWNVAPHGVLGAAYVAPSIFCPPSGCTGPTRFLYFAFDGGRDAGNNRAFPYVRVEKIDADALTRVSELDIWNPGFAFATPGLTWRPASGKDEVAISLAVGGGGSYADNSVGFLGDFVVYLTTSSNATQSNATPTVRYGDYFDVRNALVPANLGAPQGVGYSTLSYSVTQAVAGKTCAVSGCNVNLQFVLFGRNQDLFPSAVPVPR